MDSAVEGVSTGHLRAAVARFALWLDAAVGAWLVLSVVVLPGPVAESANDVLIGLLLVAIAGLNLYFLRVGRDVSPNSVTVGALSGLWLMAFSIDVETGTVLLLDNLIFGVVIFVVNVVAYRAVRYG
ncbi:MAG: hypothetical protein ABEJ06_04530 [Haloarculaceae archaeon]